MHKHTHTPRRRVAHRPRRVANTLFANTLFAYTPSRRKRLSIYAQMEQNKSRAMMLGAMIVISASIIMLGVMIMIIFVTDAINRYVEGLRRVVPQTV